MSKAPQAAFIMPAEWAKHTRCWMAWPCRLETWKHIGLSRARQAYALVAKTIAQFEPVTMLVDPSDQHEAAELCGTSITLQTLPLNDSWTRDTGPTFLLGPQQQLGGVDWIHNAWGEIYPDCRLDNDIAPFILKETQAHIFEAPLVMEGGSFHVDGQGTVLSTRECLLNPNRNPKLSAEQIETYLHQYLGTKKMIWLNQGLVGDETDGHVDEIACFIGPTKVLCLVTQDKNDANYYILQENYDTLQHTTDALGRRLEVFTVEQPKAQYLAGERLTLSYIDFYMANQGIVMPAFGDTLADEAAYAVFRQLFPKRTIQQIPALDIFTGGGGIHCITQQQPE